MDVFDPTAERERLKLTPDCASCFGLCCVAHAFSASGSFAFDKPAGKPCANLLVDFGCAIHHRLRQQGFSGCAAYTCYGAGQKVAQEAFSGVDWRQAPETAELMFQAFPIVRQLNELLWFVTEALGRCPAGPEFTELRGLLEETTRKAATPADELSWGDVDDHCRLGEGLLGRVSAAVRAAAVPGEGARPAGSAPAGRPEVARLLAGRRPDLPRADLPGVDLRGINLHGVDLHGADLHGADLHGADLRGADLRGADLWGAALSGADLRGADLRWADVMGADLGRANAAGADLSSAIFLTQSQLELAQGDARTGLSSPLRSPQHWSGGDE